MDCLNLDTRLGAGASAGAAEAACCLKCQAGLRMRGGILTCSVFSTMRPVNAAFATAAVPDADAEGRPAGAADGWDAPR